MPTALDEIVRVPPQLMNFRQSLRGKITALVIFCLTPLLVLCGLAAIYAVDRVHRYEAASALGVETALSVNAEEFAHRVQTERGLTAQARGSQSGFTNEVDAARKEVDEAAVELRAEIEGPRGSLSAETASELFEAIAEIGSMRAGVSAGVLTAHEAYDRYTSIVGAALAALEDAKLRAEALSPELGRALTVYLALASGTEFARQERALGAAALSPSVPRETKLADLSALVGAQQVAFQTIPRNATSAFALKWRALSTSDETRVVEQLRRTLLERTGASPSISAAEWFAACTARINALHALAGAMAEEIRISALREKSTAFWNAAIATMISIALILVVAALAVLVGRLVTRPLERLTNQLTTLSLDTCEMALPLERTDEIGALARAFSLLIKGLQNNKTQFRLSGERYHMLIDGVADYAIYWLDVDGYIQSWSVGASNIKGYSEQEIVNKHFSVFFTKEDQAAGLPRHVLSEAVKQGKYTADGWRMRKNGSRFWARVHVEPLRDANGSLIGFAKITHDETWRMEAEQVRMDALEEFQAVLNTMADGLIITDESGHIQTFTPAAERIFGYRDHEVLDQNIKMLMADPDHEAHDRYYENNDAAGIETLVATGQEVVAKRKCGAAFPAEFGISAYKVADKRRFVGIVRDVTKRKQVEEALRQREESLQLAWRGTGVGMWELIPATNESFFSDRFKELLGYGPDELPDIYDEWTRRLHPDDKDATFAAMQAHLNHEAPYKVEYRLMTKSGEWRWFHANGQAMWDEDGKPVRFAGSLADITESKRQKQALETSEETIRSAMQAAATGMALVAPTGRWLMVNPALCELLGFDAADLLQTDFQSVMYSDDLAQSQEMVRQMLAGETMLYRSEMRCVHKSGRIVWVHLSASVVCGQGENSSYFVWQLQDITERKQMGTMQDEFISTVNHELRTPLSSVYGAIRLLKAKNAGQLDEKGIRLLDIADQNCVRLSSLVNDILDLEKIAAGKMVYQMETIDVGSMVQDIVDRHRELAERHGVSFRTNLDAHDVAVDVDPNRFNQSLVNLLSNAAKYAPKGDIVTIEVALAEAGRVRVSVSDRGAGIPQSFRPKVFERFAQADSSATRKVGGSGLGLNITKRIIEAFGGTVSFDTAEGEGTTFHFILPIHTTEAKAA